MRDFVDDRTKGRWQSFSEVVHFRDSGKAADMPKLDDRWNPGLFAGKELGICVREGFVSGPHLLGEVQGSCYLTSGKLKGRRNCLRMKN